MRWLVWLWAGCSAKGESDTDVAPINPGGCGFSSPDNLPDVENEIFGQEHACEEQPAYDDYSEFDWLTIWYVGDFDIDDCGIVTGRETWKVFPSPNVEAKGMSDCVVVYDVTGTRVEPEAHGDFGLALAAEINLEETNCVTLDDQPLYAGFETMVFDYDVDLSGGGASVVYFTPSEANDFQGALLGDGYGNESHVTYLTDFECTSYTSF